MIPVTPREAEVLSYLTGLGVTGDWVSTSGREIIAATGAVRHRSNVSYVLRRLEDKGCIARFGRYPIRVRVIKRLEDPEVVQVELKPQHAAPRTGKKPSPWAGQRKKLVPYAGHERA